MNKPELSSEDLNRINKCDNYLYIKSIMESCTYYSEVQIGDVLLIKSKSRNKYVTGTTKSPTKFLIISKDEGFVFAKRITSNGKLGVEVICLTISYPASGYTVEVDPDMCESIIMQDESAYDPFEANKQLAKIRSKVKKINYNKHIHLAKPQDAQDYMSNIKVGDVFHTCSNFLGEMVITWSVAEILKRDVNKSARLSWGHTYKGATELDTFCIDSDINEVISILIKCIGSDENASTWLTQDRILDIRDFIDSKHSVQRKLYKDRPVNVRDTI